MSDKEKTLIGVLASRDEAKPNRSLQSVFNYIYYEKMKGGKEKDPLKDYHFIFTGGTYDRLIHGYNYTTGGEVLPLNKSVAEWLRTKSTRLPASREGGVIFLSCFITQRQCCILWPFFAPSGCHWQRYENLALMRLSDQWRVKRLMNQGSVLAWLDQEANLDARRSIQSIPPKISLNIIPKEGKEPLDIQEPPIKNIEELLDNLPKPNWSVIPRNFATMTIALIAHNEMKPRMVEFAIDHEAELKKFNAILSTGTTGKEVAAISDEIKAKIIRYHSGPKGGDIEIATAILKEKCHIVIFFIDPLMAHPHIEDIRVVFQACMIKENVVMITNEMHAREFMCHVVRENDMLNQYVESVY